MSGHCSKNNEGVQSPLKSVLDKIGNSIKPIAPITLCTRHTLWLSAMEVQDTP